tara:strand:+ start:424 stop:876 length:453 start_codon:yes stop_codon:yes gene_type:complete
VKALFYLPRRCFLRQNLTDFHASMKHLRHNSVAVLIALSSFALSSCVVEPGSTSSSLTGAASNIPPIQKFNKHDVALRFLTAYIRLDRKMALHFASYEAVSKLDWSRRHSGNIPYYDDKMLLHFSGGWARVYFQEINGSYLVSDLEVHRR